VPKTAMLIIAADIIKIVGLIPIFNLILVVSLVAVTALIFTPRKIAGIRFLSLAQDTFSVLRGASNYAPVPLPVPIIDSFKERKVTELFMARNKSGHLFRETALSRAKSFQRLKRG
jgi:asparagine N-glycosylation enzyme membrane subunit Stt3